MVLLIDEAQDLAADVLEQVRLLSNLETDTEKLIQIVLMGQSELRQLLERTRAAPARAAGDRPLPPGAALAGRDQTSTSATAWRWPGARARSRSPPTRSTRSTSSPHGIPRLVNSDLRPRPPRRLRQGPPRDQRGHGAARGPGGPGRPRDVRGPSRRWAWVGTAAAVAALLVAALALPRTLQAPEATPPARPALGRPRRRRPPTPSPTPYPDDARLERADRGHPSRAVANARPSPGSRPSGGRAALERTSLRTHLDQVRRLDLPVMLELFHPLRRDTALRGPRGPRGPRGAGGRGRRPAPPRVGRRRSTGCGPAKPSSSGRIPAGLARYAESPQARAFARAALERLGYSGPAELPEIVSALPARPGPPARRRDRRPHPHGRSAAPAPIRGRGSRREGGSREPDPRGAPEAGAGQGRARARLRGHDPRPWAQGQRASRLVGVSALALALALGALAMALWRGRAGKPLLPEATAVATAPASGRAAPRPAAARHPAPASPPPTLRRQGARPRSAAARAAAPATGRARGAAALEATPSPARPPRPSCGSTPSANKTASRWPS